jgi:hypothetical protein
MAESSHWDRVVELARISMENPAAAAVLRLHCPDVGDCEECRRLGGGDGPGCAWPCPTVLAIEQVAARPKPITIDPAEAVKQVQVPIGPWQWEWPPVVTAAQLPGHPLVQPKETP